MLCKFLIRDVVLKGLLFNYQQSSVLDPNLEIRGGGWSPKKFFPTFGPQFGLKIGVVWGGGGVLSPLPLDPPLGLCVYKCKIYVHTKYEKRMTALYFHCQSHTCI